MIQIIFIFKCYWLFHVPSFPQASGTVSPLSQVQNIEMQFPHEKRSYPYGGSKQQEFLFQDIEQYIVAGKDFDHTTIAVRFVDHVDSTSQIAYPLDKNFVHANIPLEQILPYLSVQMALKVARLHHICLGSHVLKSDFSRHFEGHACMSCNLYLSIFSVIDLKATRHRKREGKRRDTVKVNLNKSPDEFIEPSLQDMKQGNNFSHTENFEERSPLVDPSLQPAKFPPAVLSKELSHEIIHNFCANSSAAALEEAGCTVCGQLVPVIQLSKLKAVKNLLHILHASGITRVERSTASKSVCEFSGPILDYCCNCICDNCRQCLRKGKVPRNALACGLWLGKIPEVLSSLRYVEKLLIARVRINSCFVRVASSGLRKMASHVIAFKSPVPKVYHQLPQIGRAHV